jgi:hypothetical protein
VIEIRLVGDPDEVAKVVEQMNAAVRVELTYDAPSKYGKGKRMYKGVVELLLAADRPRRIPAPKRTP